MAILGIGFLDATSIPADGVRNENSNTVLRGLSASSRWSWVCHITGCHRMPGLTSKLEVIVPKPCFERPFVCAGFPTDAEAIVIGENPATPLPVDWWSFWSDKDGFDFSAFEDIYLAERARLGKGISNTRRRLNRFCERGIRCVETNAFRNERLEGAGAGVPNYAILDLLIRNMPRLRAVVAHGQIAQEYVSGVQFPEGVQTFKVRHFRMESYTTIDQICDAIVRGAPIH